MLSSGFTIPELVIVIVVSGILMTMLFGPLNDLFDANKSGIDSVTRASDVKTALRFIESDVSLAVNFDSTNDIATDPFGPDDNSATNEQWSWTNGSASPAATAQKLVTESYVTTVLPRLDTTSSRLLVYDNTDCAAATALLYNTIYFVKNDVLYRRTLGNPSATCNGAPKAQQTTCAASVSSNAQCTGGIDAKLASNITAFSVNYFNSPAASAPIGDQYTNPLAPGQARMVVITLTAGTGSSAFTGTTRITRVNGDTL